MSDPPSLAFAGQKSEPTTTATSSVYVISMNALAREGLRQIIESQGITVASSASRAEDLCWSKDQSDGLVLLDLARLEQQIQALEYVLGLSPGIRAIVLAETFELEAMTHCLRHGAHGYLVKDMPISSLVSSINLAATGEKVLPSELATFLSHYRPFAAEPPPPASASGRVPLSHREFDVLCCLMAGYPNKVIARQLNITEATIKVHVKAILRKLKVMNRTQAAIWAAAHGISSQAGTGHASPPPADPFVQSSPSAIENDDTLAGREVALVE